MRRVLVSLLLGTMFASPAVSQETIPQIGWRATLQKISHNVSGTVTVVDSDTLRVDGFTYDGGGLDVLFYLGAEETTAAFTVGLPIGEQLLGQVYTGAQGPLTIDLPENQTIANWRAISVWCVDVNVSFGHGTFRSPGDFDGNGVVNAADFEVWNAGLGAVAAATHRQGDADGDGAVDGRDFLMWQREHESPAATSATVSNVPEPTVGALAMLSLLIPLGRRLATSGA